MPASFVVSPVGTFSFPNLFTARAATPGADPRFNVTVVFDQSVLTSPEMKALKAACIEAAQEEWGPNVNLASLKMPFRKGEEKAQYGYPPGSIFINPWTKQKPGLIYKEGQPLINPSEMWAGIKGCVSVQPFAYSNQGNKGVTFLLRHVMVTDTTGPRLDGRGSPENDFKNVPGFGTGTPAMAGADDELPF